MSAIRVIIDPSEFNIQLHFMCIFQELNPHQFICKIPIFVNQTKHATFSRPSILQKTEVAQMIEFTFYLFNFV